MAAVFVSPAAVARLRARYGVWCMVCEAKGEAEALAGTTGKTNTGVYAAVCATQLDGCGLFDLHLVSCS